MVQAPSTGYIQSQGYPNTSTDTGSPCTVILEMDNLVSVEIKVDRSFYIQTENGSCNAWNYFLWIDERNNDIGFCGRLNNGREIYHTTTVPRDTRIKISFLYNSYSNSHYEVYFRINYTGESRR
jgi:hypothetical protein